LESEIQEEMVNVDANEVLRSELEALGFRVCLNMPDTVTAKVDRSVESQRMDIEQLKQTASLTPKRAEGKVVFVVPYFAEVESYDTVFSDVTLKARDLSGANVVVAVPKKVDILNRMELQRYRALQEIWRQLDVGERRSVHEHRVRLVRARFSEVQARVQSDIEEFGQASNFIFFINRQPQQAQDLNTILVDMFEQYYYKFPKVRVERINARSTTNALIERCIVNPRTTFDSDTSEVARQARDTLQALGLCSWEKAAGGKYVVELKEPEPGTEGYEIWRIVLDTVLQPDHAARVEILALPDRRYDETNWWYSRRGVKGLFYGYLTLAYAWFQGEDVPPRKLWDPDDYERMLERTVGKAS